MTEPFIEVITIAAGFALIVFRKPFVKSVIKFQEDVWGIHIDTEKQVKSGLQTIPIFGFLLILLGAWNLIRIYIIK